MRLEQQKALETVAVRLQAHRIPFLLGGSGLLSALGLPVDVADLDLMLRAGDATAFRETAEKWIREFTTQQTDFWASDWFARLRVDATDVDAVGGLAFKTGGHIARVPFRGAGAWRIGAVDVPLADPAVWWAIYSVYQPPKAALLEPVVPAGQRRAIRAELGIGP